MNTEYLFKEDKDLTEALNEFKKQNPNSDSGDIQTFIIGWQEAVKKLIIPIVSENKPMDEDYPLIPMKDIDDEARTIAVRWHENATDWVGDKHKLASDIMNYARRKSSANAR